MNDPEQPSPRDGVTARSVVLGVGMVLVVVIGAPFGFFVVGGPEPTWSYFPWCVGFPFVVLVLLNAALRRLLPRVALGPTELLVIGTMGLCVSGIPTFILGWGLGIITSPYYHATPENNWATVVHPFLPDWTLPQAGEGLTWFYEGIPTGQAFPWDVWVAPMLWWVSVILAVYAVSFSLVVLLRRQWVEHERLAFPMTELPRRLVEMPGPGSTLAQKSFWIGAGSVFLIMCFNMISYFLPGFPDIGFHRVVAVQLGRDIPVLFLSLHLPVLAIMFFASASISFSIWFFYLIATLQETITNRIGFDLASPEPFAWGLQTLTWQAWGSFFAMVVWSVWMGRTHLGDVWRHVSGKGPQLDDSNEMMSYRAAVAVLLAALTYVVWWLCRAGMDLHVALLVVLALIVGYLGITRLVIQSGLYYLTMPITGQAFATAITGTALTPSNIGAISTSYSFFGDVQSIFMTSAAHGSRMVERPQRRLAWALGIAVIVGFGAGLPYLIHICYEYGANNLSSGLFKNAGNVAFRHMGHHLDNPAGADWWRLTLFSIGGFVYSVLMACQYRFAWWPLHPVGLAVASLWMIRRTVVSVFLAWAIKSAVMRYGGIQLYRQLRPFFLGIIAGYFLGVGASFLVDWIWFFGTGHRVYN